MSATCDRMPGRALVELTCSIVVIEESSQHLHAVSGSFQSSAAVSSV